MDIWSNARIVPSQPGIMPGHTVGPGGQNARVPGMILAWSREHLGRCQPSDRWDWHGVCGCKSDANPTPHGPVPLEGAGPSIYPDPPLSGSGSHKISSSRDPERIRLTESSLIWDCSDMRQAIPWNRTTWKLSGRWGANGKRYGRKIERIIECYGTYHGDQYCASGKHLYEATWLHFCALPLTMVDEIVLV